MALVLVADDNQDLANTVARALARQGYEVLVAHTGHDAIAKMRQHQPDVVILDVVLPDLDGFEVCRRVRTMPDLAAVPILFLTVKQDIDDVLRGFGAGGDDYITKPFDLRELQARLEALLRRAADRQARHTHLQVGDLILDPATREATTQGHTAQLTPTEYELLRYLIEQAGRIVSVDELLQNVWGYPPSTGDPDLVRAHIHNLRHKIEPDPSRPAYIKTIPRHGYLIST